MIAIIFQLLACQDPSSPEGLFDRTVSFHPQSGVVCFYITGSQGSFSCVREPHAVVEVISAEVEVVSSDTASNPDCPTVDNNN